MVRTSHAIAVGAVMAVFASLISFLGGWTAARAMGNAPLDTLAATVLANRSGEETTPSELRDSFGVFWEVWALVNQEFYRQEPLDEQKMAYGAIRGMLQSLGDDYTTFQEPEVAEKSRESMQGKFEGIGVYMRIDKGNVLVDRPIKNSPAMKAGRQSDDIIVKVDGTPVASLIAGLSEAEMMDTIATKIRGPQGSTVRLTIERPTDKRTFDVEIVRGEVPLISVSAQMLEGGIAYVQITEFKATTTKELDDALRELLPQHPSRMILDLRNNPGGFLVTAQEVLGRFYEGIALYEQDSIGKLDSLRTMNAPPDARIFDLPLVVLINGHSASASEIVAGALRDQRPNTTLVGEKSFGKGSVQNVHQLHDGSSVRITIAHWLTPSKSEIHKIGITPEEVVPESQDAQYAVPCTSDKQPAPGQKQCNDAQLARGLELLSQQSVSSH